MTLLLNVGCVCSQKLMLHTFKMQLSPMGAVYQECKERLVSRIQINSIETIKTYEEKLIEFVFRVDMLWSVYVV